MNLTSETATPKTLHRSPWRFSLRTMLVAMLIASVAIGWWRDRRLLTGRIGQLEAELLLSQKAKAPAWSLEQLLGRPDTSGAGDIATAWASQTQDGQPEWLILEYLKAVRPATVEIHETYNPGAVVKVSAFDATGAEVVVWQGKDPTPPANPRGISKIPISASFKTKRIKVYIDSHRFPGWNEIDAVGLTDTAGKTQWAIGAEASSTYSGGSLAGFSLGIDAF